MQSLRFSILMVFSLLAISCRKETGPQPPAGNEIFLRLRHVSMGEQLEQGKTIGDSSDAAIALSKFQYYISGIRLENDNPMETYRQPGSFHLVKGLDNKGEILISLKEVPERYFHTLVLQLGLDSSTNHKAGGQGALDPGNGMYWPWSSEYKFMVVEGNFQYPDTSGAFLFHIAGDACYRSQRIPLTGSGGQQPVLRNASQINLEVEFSALTGAPHPVDFRTLNNVMSVAAGAGKLADNYASGSFIRFSGIQ